MSNTHDPNGLGISRAPWHYDDSHPEFEGICGVYDADGNFIVGTGDMEDCEYSAIADGRLMAAAPDLYDALSGLESIGKALEGKKSISDSNAAILRSFLRDARAALAKARGEASHG